MIPTTYTAPPEIIRIRNMALIAGVALFVLLLVGALIDRDQFFHAYLIGFVFWIGISLGSLALLMLQHLTGGAWGLVIRRVLEASTLTLPLMLLLFVPIVLGLGHIYSWTNLAQMQGDALKAKAANYLNPPFFMGRALIYFAIWSAAAILLNWFSAQQDRTADPRLTRRMRMISGPGLVLLIFGITFAVIDWVMSLDPAWSSTIFGFLFVASWSLSALAFTIIAMDWLGKRHPLSAVLQPSHFHDLGNLLLALVMLWTYFAFSQFLIIWSGNLPEETVWYVARTRGGWGAIAFLVAILHFGFPFLMLLSRGLKRSADKLARLALLILIMRGLDLIWLVEPQFSPAHLHVSWMELVAPLAIGGLWVATFAWQLQRRPVLAFNDPQTEEVLEAAQHVEHAGH